MQEAFALGGDVLRLLLSAASLTPPGVARVDLALLNAEPTLRELRAGRPRGAQPHDAQRSDAAPAASSALARS